MTIPVPLPPGIIRDTTPRADSGAVQRGDWVRYINGGNIERWVQVHTLGPSPMDATLDLVAITWDVLGAPLIQTLSQVPSGRIAGAWPYWIA